MKKEETITELLLLCCNKFYDIEETRIADQAVKMVFDLWPRNTCREQVLTKVVVLNSLYNTALYDVHTMAEHIIRQRVDPKFSQGDITVVDDIRNGHGIRNRKTGKERDFYSFATKYSHWHVPSRYVIYDTFVDAALKDLNERLGFYRSFSSARLKQEYSMLKEVIDSLASIPGLTSLNYKKLDQALWMYGKYLKNKLPGGIKAQLDVKRFQKDSPC